MMNMFNFCWIIIGTKKKENWILSLAHLAMGRCKCQKWMFLPILGSRYFLAGMDYELCGNGLFWGGQIVTLVQDLIPKVREQDEEIMQLRKHLVDYSVKAREAWTQVWFIAWMNIIICLVFVWILNVYITLIFNRKRKCAMRNMF